MIRPFARSLRGIRCLPVLALALLLAPAGRTAAGDDLAPGLSPEETRQELEQVCKRLTSGENPYFGAGIIDRLKARLARTPEDRLEMRLRLRGLMASHMVRLGRLDEAVEQLDTLLALLAKDRDRLSADTAAELLHTARFTLATAELLVGEDRNCLAHHTASSCILPLQPEAVHVDPGPVRRAAELEREILKDAPDDVQARWLLNLASMLSGDGPAAVPKPFRLPPDALTSKVSFPRWKDIASTLGVSPVDLSGGAVMDDFDGDGLLDIITSTWDPCGPLKAFKNDGHGGFTDVTHAWGLDGQLGGLNLTHADFDGDGMLDLMVMRGAWLGKDGRIRNSLLRNDLARPAGRFSDVTFSAGLAYPAFPSHSAAWGDFDGDGDLDVFVANESPIETIAPQDLDRGPRVSYRSQLFRNEGDGTFRDVTRQAGVSNDRYAKGSAWGDYDDDGDLDLYVSNLGPNRLYRNEGDGTFVDVGPELGVDEPRAQSFATWFFDYDNDGDLDLYVNRYGARIEQVTASYLGLPVSGGAPVLYRNDGGRFTDVSDEVGFHRPILPMGSNYGDLDNDGFLDIYLGTGVPDPDALMPNVMYRNDGGRRFEDITFAGGFGHLQKGHGIAFGDLDNDGDQDLLEQLGGAFPYDAFGNMLLENPTSELHPDHAWITLRLEGKKANRFGVGARIEVVVRQGEATRSVHLQVDAGGSFGESSFQQEIGLGVIDRIERIVIRWPGSGTVDTFGSVAPDHVYRAIEGAKKLLPVELPRIRLGAEGPAPAHEHHHP